MPYTVLNTRTEESTTHRTWAAAMREASRYPSDEIEIIERDRDGERTYNTKGEILGRDGHYHQT